jgi:hypothetical protein
LDWGCSTDATDSASVALSSWVEVVDELSSERFGRISEPISRFQEPKYFLRSSSVALCVVQGVTCSWSSVR